MSNENDDGRTFLDDLFDKADDALSAVERIADGGRGVLPRENKDGSRLIAETLSDEEGLPEWIVLRLYGKNGESTTARYQIEKGKRPGKLIDIGDGR